MFKYRNESNTVWATCQPLHGGLFPCVVAGCDGWDKVDVGVLHTGQERGVEDSVDGQA